MTKQPWMKFYPSDWRADPKLRMCSLSARGLWVELMALMHEASPYGHLLINGTSPSDAQVAVLAGAPSDQVSDLLGELDAAGVFSRTRDGVIYSRRMTRDEKKSQTARKNGKKGGSPTLGKTTTKPALDNQKDKGRDKAQKPEARSQKETPTPYGPGDAEADYNRLAEQVGLRKSIKLNDKRRKAISARLEEYGPDGWRAALAAVRSQDWMIGKGNGDRKWKADLDYICRPDPFLKLLEIAESEGLKSAGPAMPESDDQWRRCVRQFVNHKVWHAPGPMPGEPGCNAPDAILEEFGIDTLGGQLRLVAGT